MLFIYAHKKIENLPIAVISKNCEKNVNKLHN